MHRNPYRTLPVPANPDRHDLGFVNRGPRDLRMEPARGLAQLAGDGSRHPGHAKDE